MVTYPVRSPQGATILIYAHDTGVTLLWRGGIQPVRQPEPASNNGSAKKPPNGTSGDEVVMLLDSDDERPPSAPCDGPPKPATPVFVNKPDLEGSVSQCSSDCQNIIQTLDLALGAPVHHVVALPMTPCLPEDAPFAGADVLKDKMIFGLSCLTSEVLLVLLPLTPPSIEHKTRKDLCASLAASLESNGAWGETVFKLGGQPNPSDGLAISLFKTKQSVKSRGLGDTSTDPAAMSSTKVVVASHSREASGALRLWEVDLDQEPPLSPIQPFQTEYLPSPLCSISFNPTLNTQLLATESTRAVRIYDYSTPSVHADDGLHSAFPPQGSWLLSLYPPFIRQSASRKPIIAAEWISRGRAILALLADGQWGIWSIDEVNLSVSNLLSRQNSGIRDGALSTFSITGYIEGTSGLRNPTSQKGPASGGDFVPMTPHTRKESIWSSSSLERLHTIRGGVVVTPIPSRGSATGDESVIVWLGGSEHVVVIPGISAFWAAQEQRGKSDGGGVNLFSGTTPTRMVRLDTLVAGLMGERCNGVQSIVRLENGSSSKDAEQGVPIDIVIRGDNRLVIVRMEERGAGARIGGVVGWKRKLGENKTLEPASAIVVHPRTGKPCSKAFNLSVMPSDSLGARAISARKQSQESVPSQESLQRQRLPRRTRSSGLTFVEQISKAADADDDGEERNVEEEILDIMEIDRELELLEDQRLQGRKKVFFEEG